MRRIGRALPVGALLISLFALPALAEVEIRQEVDRTEVGTHDTFRLVVSLTGAPDSAEVEFPPADDFEVLSSSQSSQRSIQLTGRGPPVVQTIRRHTLVMRPNRAGRLTLKPVTVRVGGHVYRSEAIQMTVKPGHVSSPRAQASPSDPFRGFPFPQGFPDPFNEDDDSLPQMDVPRGDSDLFLRAIVDRDEVYVGEQVTLSLYIFSRVDLSSVDDVNMPKLEGFWSEDIESPTQLSAEQRVLNGVTYRAYLLRKRAIFPVKAGTIDISPAEAEITTGFLFAGHRVHRVSNPLTVKVKPLPPGAPAGMANANVGSWRLSTEASKTTVALGEPVTVRVILEGVGNVRNVTPPPLTAPQGLKVYDPSTTDKVVSPHSKVQGRRVHEYLVMPQQTGNFTLPALSFPYFDPKSEKYEVARTEPLALTVTPGNGAATGTVALNGPGGKNVLPSGGIRPLRYQAAFVQARTPPWRHALFFVALLAPLGALIFVTVGSTLKGRLMTEDAGSVKKRRAKEAQRRLAVAERLAGEGSSQAFYAEIEKALIQFMEVRLETPVGGLTRDALAQRLTSAGVTDKRRERILRVLDACDMGRFAPGVERATKERVLDDAAAIIDGWDA